MATLEVMGNPVEILGFNLDEDGNVTDLDIAFPEPIRRLDCLLSDSALQALEKQVKQHAEEEARDEAGWAAYDAYRDRMQIRDLPH